ncbi:MAG: glycosyltransferase [Armatimonadetes bacterium]|nr:glycosyltransferase [Armatimonadota bacterium]
MAEVSVVVPAYNPGRQLLDCLSSLAGMDYPSSRLEVIVVDDRSTEDVGGIVSAHFPQFGVVRRAENGGCDAAREDGIQHASGRIIAHTDTDCIVCPEWARRINANIQTGAPAATGPVIHETGLRAQLVAITQFGHSQCGSNGRTDIFPGCNFAIAREILGEFAYRQERLRDGADRLLSWRIASAGLNITYDTQMIVHHYPPLQLRHLLKRYLQYSRVTYHLRVVDRRLPGGRLVGLGPATPFLLAAARLIRDYERLICLSFTRSTPLYLALPLAALLPLIRALDACAMLGTQVDSIKQRKHKTHDN